MIRYIIKIGAGAGAITAIITLWFTFVGPVIATSADIKRLDRQQTDIAVDLYNGKVRGLIVQSPPDNAPANQKRLWEEELNQAKHQRDKAEERKIELGR